MSTNRSSLKKYEWKVIELSSLVALDEVFAYTLSDAELPMVVNGPGEILIKSTDFIEQYTPTEKVKEFLDPEVFIHVDL